MSATTLQVPGVSAEPGRSHAHMPGLTGLRGLAVAAVVAYHLGHLQGGFVGVDLFFVLSGFLITSLLLGRSPETPAEMLRWWGRRIRRLTPAVAVVVIAVLVAFRTQSGIALDGLATLTWWQNWQLVLGGASYWESTTSPLRHAWSLSIEEQFYLVWPPVLALAVHALRGRGRAALRAAVLVGTSTAAVASFGWAAWLSTRAGADLSRIYYGSDTRAGALLLGCALAAFLRGRRDRAAGRGLTTAAAGGAGALLVLAVVASPEQPWLYRGGLALAAASSVLVVAASSASGPLGRLLSWQPLQWLGVRSYAIYLWSWPTQVLVQREAPGWHPATVALVTVTVTLVLSDVSLRLVEDPLRRRSSWASALRPRRAAWVAGTALVAVALVLASSSTELSVEERLAQEFERRPDPVPEAPACAEPATSVPDWRADGSSFDPETVERGADPGAAACADAERLLVVGDSTGRGAANGLRRLSPPGLQVWDRTELGCGMKASEECRDWRDLWSEAVDRIDPDVVLVYLGVSADLVPGEDPPFLSEEATALRRREIGDAIDLLGRGGAKVAWILPPAPMPEGAFYCGGAAEDTSCDPDWVARWQRDVEAVASARGATTIDVAGWVDGRAATAEQDRPDGAHLSGPALDAHAAWLVTQLPARR